MKRNCWQFTVIIFVVIHIFGCANLSTIEGDIPMPQTFEKVWYRSTIAKPGILAMSDTGTLIVNSNSLEFEGEKERISIVLSEIHRISFEKIGSDFINNWIVIVYGAKESPSYAVMSAGKALGWAAGSDKIFSTIEYIIKKNNLTSVEISK